jgi:hypothetical protein
MSKELTQTQPGAIETPENQNLPQSVTPNQLLAIAVEKGADLAQLEKLMDLQERFEANEAKKAYVKAMARFREDCPAIKKTRDAHNSKYAGLAETIAQIKGLLSDHGLSHTWRTNQENGLISVTCCVTHTAGHQECTTLSAGADQTGSKNSIQAIGSTITYLERYTLFAILGIASTDQDDDAAAAGEPVETITDHQAADLRALLEEHNRSEEQLVKYLQKTVKSTRVLKLEDIPKQIYHRVVYQVEAAR